MRLSDSLGSDPKAVVEVLDCLVGVPILVPPFMGLREQGLPSLVVPWHLSEAYATRFEPLGAGEKGLREGVEEGVELVGFEAVFVEPFIGVALSGVDGGLVDGGLGREGGVSEDGLGELIVKGERAADGLDPGGR